jgi:antitoxin component of MazEF toxin-antitoxin module
MHAKVRSWGNSLAIRLPYAITSHFELRDGSDVRLSIKDAAIVIEPVGASQDLDALLAGIPADHAFEEAGWGWTHPYMQR